MLQWTVDSGQEQLLMSLTFLELRRSFCRFHATTLGVIEKLGVPEPKSASDFQLRLQFAR